MSVPPQFSGSSIHLSEFPPEYLTADNSAPLFNTCIAFLVIDTTFIALLYAARMVKTKSDARQKTNMSMLLLMTCAYLICLAKIGLGILAVYSGGAGRHTVTLSLGEITICLKLNIILQIICPLTTSFSKLGILVLLDTILGTISQRYKLAIRATFILVALTAVVQVIIPFTNCKPFAYNWNKALPGSCAMDGLVLWKYMSIPNVVTTVIMLFIPLPKLWHLRVARATKLGLFVVFSVCIAGVVAASARFAAFVQVKSFYDFTWKQITPLSWTIVESGVYLIAGVLPTLRPLVRKVFGDMGAFDRLLARTFGGSVGESGTWGKKSWGKFVVKEPGSNTGSDVSSKAMVTVNDEDLNLVETKESATK